jgi:hypothetical protein
MFILRRVDGREFIEEGSAVADASTKGMSLAECKMSGVLVA